MSDSIPADLKALFEDTSDYDAVMGRLMEVYGKAVSSDRCLLFLYNWDRNLSRCTHAWEAKPEYALHRRDAGWEEIPANIATEDPMFGEALHNPEALYIDNVRTADPNLVNAEYELEHFQHHSLIHAPLLEDGVLWGILEPCTIAEPYTWTDHDRAVTAWTQEKLLPLAKAYVAAHCP